MKLRTLVTISIPVLVILAFAAIDLLNEQAEDSSNVIFQIGREDKDFSEFKQSGFAAQNEYSCEAGVKASDFPQKLLVTPNHQYKDEGVVRIEISFTLDKEYDNVVLRLARGGIETTEVSVDGGEKYLVTDSMLGSNEGFTVGSYDLELGSFEKGSHTIELTVANDGKGNGSYQWDALVLYTSPT